MLLKNDEAYYGLCAECAALFPVENESRCESCGRPLISETGHCLSCRAEDPPSFDGVISLYPYLGRHKKILSAYKFGKNRCLGNFFAEKFLEGCALFPPFDNKPVWVPVPPRSGKIKKTGWDQIEYIARAIECKKQIQVERCLKRLPTKSQKELGRQGRKTNLKGRILTVKKPPENVILFDDVFTTGSTMDVCAAALKDAGSKTVHGICLYYD
ncbi:amidophosphoribosyltransferase [Spirochaetia bacterium]|nr:amidophosphoribosyltransferase [Spirochaetia bacterium]